MMGLIDRVYDTMAVRRQRILDGKVNCIPSPIPSFDWALPGVEQGTYYLISGAAKSAKSRFTNFFFVYNTILYAYSNPDIIRLKIFYALLEETAENITLKFISYLLLLKYQERVDIRILKSINDKKLLNERILEHAKSEEIQRILRFFEEHVIFIPDRNPTGIYQTVRDYAKEHGTTHTKWVEGLHKDIFDWYEPNDPDEYVLCVVDHVSLIQTEQGMDLRNSIKKLSEYMKILRNNYKYIPVVVQQQNSETLSLDAFKANKIRPTQKGCADSQDPPKDCDMMLGLTNPYSYEIPKYCDYDITQLRGFARFLEVVLGRDGEGSTLCGLFFDGATGMFKSLPKHDDIVRLQRVYKKVEEAYSTLNKPNNNLTNNIFLDTELAT